MSCVFCRIVAGRAEATLVYRDAVCAAFMDIQPVNPGHVLVVPVRHAAHLLDVPRDEWEAVAALGRRVAAALRSSDIACEGVNLLLADGPAAGQEVFHTHLHVIPRFAGDGFGFRFPKAYRELPSRETLESLGGKLREQLSSRIEEDVMAWKPQHHNSISPYLIVPRVQEVIEFLEAVFGASVVRRFDRDDGSTAHAEVLIDDSIVMMGSPLDGSSEPCHVHVYVPDVDASYAAALAAGGASVQEPGQGDDPDRRAGVRGPGGTTWWIATQVGH